MSIDAAMPDFAKSFECIRIIVKFQNYRDGFVYFLADDGDSGTLKKLSLNFKVKLFFFLLLKITSCSWIHLKEAHCKLSIVPAED